jgi:lipoyl(octanoyl) transferase
MTGEATGVVPSTIRRMRVTDLGTLPYRDAWAVQERVHAEVVAGGEEQVLLVEHPPVITTGRRHDVTRHVLATPERLAELGVEFVESDRGGDVTFHGPGQVVAYPIVRLIDHGLSVGGYVRRVEETVIAALRELGVAAQKDTCAIGVWAPDPAHSGQLAKVTALGVRIRRGVSMHGVAVNVETDLRYFELIVPCGLTCRPVTSIRKLLGEAGPDVAMVKRVLAEHVVRAFASKPAVAK